MKLFEKLMNMFLYMNNEENNTKVERKLVGCLVFFITFVICLIPTYILFSLFMCEWNPAEWYYGYVNELYDRRHFGTPRFVFSAVNLVITWLMYADCIVYKPT